MCAPCVMAALAGATTGRAWLAASVPALADPRRMRVVTVALLASAALVPSVSLSGSGAPAPAPQPPPVTQAP